MSEAAVEAPTHPQSQWAVAAVGLMLLAGGALALGAESWRHAALFVVGGLLGVSLYHAVACINYLFLRHFIME